MPCFSQTCEKRNNSTPSSSSTSPPLKEQFRISLQSYVFVLGSFSQQLLPAVEGREKGVGSTGVNVNRISYRRNLRTSDVRARDFLGGEIKKLRATARAFASSNRLLEQSRTDKSEFAIGSHREKKYISESHFGLPSRWPKVSA